MRNCTKTPPNTYTYADLPYFFSREKMKFNCVQASLNIVDHIGYLHSTFKFTEPFFISFMIFPGKTNDVIYVLVLYEEIEARRGGLSAAQDQCVKQKLELCGSWAKLFNSTGALSSQCPFHPFPPPVCCWDRRENQGESGDRGTDIWLKLRSRNPAQ